MSRAGLDQSQPDQRHVPSAVADRLRLHRQQCGHPPAGRDKAPSRTRRPDGYKPSAKGGITQKTRHRQNAAVTAAGSVPPPVGGEGARRRHHAAEETPAPGGLIPSSAGGPHGLSVVVPASYGQFAPSAPSSVSPSTPAGARARNPGQPTTTATTGAAALLCL